MLEETKYCCRKEEVDAAASILLREFFAAGETIHGETQKIDNYVVCPSDVGVLCHMCQRILI